MQSQASALVRFANLGIDPIFMGSDADAPMTHVNLSPNLTLAKGTVLAQVMSAANDVQTLTIGGTPTGGTFPLTITHPLTGIASTITVNFNSAVSATQTLVDAALGAGLCTVGGGTLPGATQTFTFGGAAGNRPVPPMTVATTGLTGGAPTAAVAHTTTGATAGTYAAYSAAGILAPAAAPTVAGNGSGSGFGAGGYATSYTFVTAAGESTPSPATFTTLTAAQNLRVSAITGLNAAVTSVKFYVNGVYAGFSAVTSGSTAQTDLTGSSITIGGVPPRSNSAGDGVGLSTAKVILKYPCASSPDGSITLGTTATGGPHGEVWASAAVYLAGYFNPADLVGLDQAAVDQLGRMKSGAYNSATGGILRVI